MRSFTPYAGKLIVILSLILAGCAQQGAPTGGPKDEEPPVVLRSEPDNYSTGFDGKEIAITFDEFINTGNFGTELVVSPPMEEKPVIKLRKKTLLVEFEEELKENTTYTFNFGEGIKDLNEGNVLLNYEFVFSTGDYLDSLSVKGTLRNAFDLSIPESPISVMLYNELNDSLPLKEIPYYVGRADKQGNYAVNNLRPDTYKMFVLKDGNNNFIYDQPAENIAFLDSALRVDGNYFKKLLLESGKYDSTDFLPDTTTFEIDTAGLAPDSIALVLDSIAVIRDSIAQLRPDPNTVFIDLKMFQEASGNQFLSDYTRDTRYMNQVIFSLPLTDSFSYAPVEPAGLQKRDFIGVFGKNRDTLTLWAADSNIARLDTLGLKFSYLVKDSTGADVFRHDTLDFVFRKPSGKSAKKDDAEKKKKLGISALLNGGRQDFHRNLVLQLEHPLGATDSSLITLYHIPDSVEIPQDPRIAPDTGNIRRIRIMQDWEPGGKYKLVLLPGAITDVYHISHDTTEISFNAMGPEDYGLINLELSNVNEAVILIQLFQQDQLLRQKTIMADGTYTFENLDPRKYRIKFVFDANRNGKWDTGDYLEKRQPERVEFLPKDISVRANWDHDASYIMGSSDEAPSDGKEAEGTGDDEDESPANLTPGTRQDDFNIPVQGGNNTQRRPTQNNKPELPGIDRDRR